MSTASGTSKTAVDYLMRKYKLKPKASFGQNFLIDDAAYQTIIHEADIHPDDCVIEIGTGWGTLTAYLSERARAVVTIESDEALCSAVTQELRTRANVTVVCGNALSFSVNELLSRTQTQYDTGKIVANIPYYLTGKLLRKFLPDPQIMKIILLVQKEVAERIVASSGSMSMLSLTTQWYAKVHVAAAVPRSSFFPIPKVDSSVISITPHDTWRKKLALGISEDDLFQIARMAFHMRRKKIVNSLSAGMHWEPARVKSVLASVHIDESARPQDLQIEDWIHLAGAIRA